MRNLFMLGPCDACPFRTDEGAVRLRQSRKEGIAHALRMGDVFHCHKTVQHSDQYDDYGEAIPILDNAKFCGGALVLMEKEGVPNGAKQVAERLGILDPEQLHIAAPVYDSLQEWVEKESI